MDIYRKYIPKKMGQEVNQNLTLCITLIVFNWEGLEETSGPQISQHEGLLWIKDLACHKIKKIRQHIITLRLAQVKKKSKPHRPSTPTLSQNEAGFAHSPRG